MFAILDRHIVKPAVQAGLLFAGGLVLMILAWLLTVSNVYAQDPLFPWSISAAFMLLFAMVNSLLSLRADNSARYWGQSVYSYMGLALCSGMAAWLFSGISLRDAGTYRWIFIVVTLGFLVFLSMVNFMKKIVRYAEREEWNEPKKRK